MGHIIIKIVVTALALFIGAKFLRGVRITDFIHALIAALVIGLLNATLGQVLDFLTTPINWLTLGLFSFVVDAVILMIADYFLKGLKIDNFWWALALALLFALFNTVTHSVFL